MTCDNCGTMPGPAGLHRHHERHEPDVIEYLCAPCHERTHRVRGFPGRPRFDATFGLTLREARAVAIFAALEGVDEHEARRRRTVADMLAGIDRVDGEVAA